VIKGLCKGVRERLYKFSDVRALVYLLCEKKRVYIKGLGNGRI